MTQNKDKKRRLTAKQTKAIEALMAADTMEKAAQEAGVTRASLYRWLKEDFFIKELNRVKRQLIERQLLKLQRSTGVAVDTLINICRDKKAPAGSRVAAAREILGSTIKALELGDLKERVDALEQLGRKGAVK